MTFRVYKPDMTSLPALQNVAAPDQLQPQRGWGNSQMLIVQGRLGNSDILPPLKVMGFLLVWRLFRS